MSDTVSCWPWTNRPCVCVWNQTCYSCSMLYDDVVISPCPTTLNGADGCVFIMFVECMAGIMMPWTNRSYVYIFVRLNLKVLFVFYAVWGRNLNLVAVLSKYTAMAMMVARLCSLHVWHDVLLALDKQTVRSHMFDFNLKLSFVFDAGWGRDITAQIHYNVDYGRACVHLYSLNIWNGVVLALDK